ncbi:glycogen debranching protein [Botryobacter ruber]|uniref:glycogen debranching protein n=1 Tax=Botryobacter ruber TaxID=2171629 RepID=UPI000E0B4381|nr:isoamylase [Botryobacter ruber]
MASWYSKEGSSYPLGVSFIPEEDAYNFALYSKNATQVTLLLYREGDYVNPVASFDFDPLRHKSQRTWHYRVKRSEMGGARFYAYRVNGTSGSCTPAFRFDPDKILLDPYAREVFFPPAFSRTAAGRPGSNAGKAPLGYLYTNGGLFDWEGDKPVHHEHDLIIYETHVRGFTRNPNAGVAAEKRGTYAGLLEKIPYLKELGITAVELMPVQQFDPQENNYWGYQPLSFFAPHKGYAANQQPSGDILEFKTMVRELHKAGIEVILDVVYNHTTEEGSAGPTYHLKGIDSTTYYLLDDTKQNSFVDLSGTGNTLRTDHPAVQHMIMDSLRFWVKEMHVDGFRFDLASIFTRRSDGTVGEAPIFSDIATEPDFAQVRLIAEPWDAAGLYQLGRSFPGINWFQWNGGFRDDLRRFVKGDEGMTGALVQRLYGSDNFFPDDVLHAYHPYQSINYITSHDGFMLYDLVSYNEKRNLSNGHHNADGEKNNLSWNCGWEGDANVPEEVVRLRKQQARNFFTLLLLANGTPMFVAGDEFLQTQHGNNNPYNQDNDKTWLDWNRLVQMRDHFEFVKKLIAFRKRHPTLGRSRFWREEVTWFGANGLPDFSAASHSIAYFLSGKSQNDTDLYVMINAHWESKEFSFLAPGPWFLVINTQAAFPDDFLEEDQVPVQQPVYEVGPRAVAVFVKQKEDQK